MLYSILFYFWITQIIERMKISTLRTILCFIFLSPFLTNAQVGIGTSNPDPSSMLEIASDKAGILIPRMTENDKNNISNPKKGLLIFQNNAEQGFWYYNGSIWEPLASKGGEFTSESGIVYNTTSLKNDDFAVGTNKMDNQTTPDDDSRIVFDKSQGSFRAGYNNTASWDTSNRGSYSIGMGANTTASASYAIAMGRESVASAMYAVSLGRSNVVSGSNATSFGYLNNATADYATTFGRGNTASGQYSIAGVIASKATGLHAISLGNTSVASGENSLALGRLNVVSGLNAAAIGFTNTATQEGAFAFGSQSNATANNAMAFGYNLEAKSYNEIVLGLFNERYTPASTTTTVGTDRIFTIGNGFRSGSTTTYNNALTILKNGHTGIGTSTPTEALEIHGNDSFGGDADFDAHSYGSNITSFHIRSAAGTRANPKAVSNKSNQNFYNMEAQGYDGATYRNAASIRMGTMATNRTGLNDMPGRIDFDTAPDGGGNPINRMRIDDQGHIGIGTGNAVITEKLVVSGKIKATSVNFSGLQTFSSDSTALSGGLVSGDMYKTADGNVRIVL